jgi:hypothetical protein
VADLSKEKRRGHLRQRVTETEHETATKIHFECQSVRFPRVYSSCYSLP